MSRTINKDNPKGIDYSIHLSPFIDKYKPLLMAIILILAGGCTPIVGRQDNNDNRSNVNGAPITEVSPSYAMEAPPPIRNTGDYSNVTSTPTVGADVNPPNSVSTPEPLPAPMPPQASTQSQTPSPASGN
ncbi:MAG: hypothetical protein H6772_02300 [Pseudomonadales bacterium]|nr:hypothetical protein [Pseudomonadales bacterium]